MLKCYLFPWDVEEVLKIKLLASRGPDCVAWHYEKLEIFTVRSAYKLAIKTTQDLDAMGSSTTASGECGVWKKLWRLRVLLKTRNFAWKMIKNGLPTNANRQYRHITVDVCYVLSVLNTAIML
jgi:hypothetical protein